MPGLYMKCPTCNAELPNMLTAFKRHMWLVHKRPDQWKCGKFLNSFQTSNTTALGLIYTLMYSAL